MVPEGGGRVRMNSLQEAVLQAVKRLHGDFGVGAITAGFNGETLFIALIHGSYKVVVISLEIS